jgi:hypothetical protein
MRSDAEGTVRNIVGGSVRFFVKGSTALLLMQLCGCVQTQDARTQSKPFGSPLVLDLDGDGIEVLEAWDASVTFDFEGDGFQEKTAWVDADDGFLVCDRNRNGKIDDASELFGENPTDYEETVLRPGGFARLARFDSNRDGMITPADHSFEKLLIWRDLDESGSTDSGELQSLSDEGIRSIDLRFSKVNENLGDAYVTARSRFTRQDGTSGEIADVWFQTDPRISTPTVEIEVSERTKHLPYIGGSGLVYDLHSAIEVDPVLRGMVEELVQMPPADLDQYDSRVEAIFLRWTRSEGVPPKSRGRWVDARRLVALERWRGARFFQAYRGFTPNPLRYAGEAEMEAYRKLLSQVGLKLFAQVEAGDVLWPEYEYAMDAFMGLKPGYSAKRFVSRVEQNSPQEPHRRILYWRAIVRLADSLADYATVYSPESGAASEDGESLVKSVDAALSKFDPVLSYDSLRRLNSEPQTAFPDHI